VSKFLRRGIASRSLKKERYASADESIVADAKQVNEDRRAEVRG
jgi:hypothetical protein